VLQSVILTDKHNRIELKYWFLLSTATCYDCLNQPLSGRQYSKKDERRLLPTAM